MRTGQGGVTIPHPLEVVCKYEQWRLEMNEVGWISVDDKLPPESSPWVLAYANGAMNCMWCYKGKWSDPTYAQAHNITIEDITHWMPLPEKPAIQSVQRIDT